MQGSNLVAQPVGIRNAALLLIWTRLLGSGEVKTQWGRFKPHPPQKDSRVVRQPLATEHKEPSGAGVETQRGHTSCA
jgi:hypothetical protein